MICPDCRRPIVGQAQYRQNPEQWRARGYARAAGDRCNSCDTRTRRGGHRPPQPPRATYAQKPLSPSEVAHLRRLVGLPPDGPTKAHRRRWRHQERADAC